MKILWFPRLQFDTDRLHITTWREMAREINCAGHTLRIAVAGKNTNGDFGSNYISIPIVRVKFLRILSFWVNGFGKFVKHLIEMLPDAVILDVFTIWFGLLLLCIPRSRRPLIVVDNRTPVYIEKYQSARSARLMLWYSRLCFAFCRRHFDGMTVITDYYREYLARSFRFDSGRVGVWNSGVNTDRFDPALFSGTPRPDFLRGKFVLMQHGEISHGRGIFQTIEALNIIGRDDICLLLVGGVVRGEKARQETFAEIAQADRGGRVHIVGPVSHSRIPEYVSFCDCAVMPYPKIEYWNNNNPIKLVEYLSMARPVICTDMWTFRAVMGDAPCAVYVQDNDPAKVAEAIMRCVRHRDELAAWGREGRRIALERYSWEKQAARLVDFLEALRRPARATVARPAVARPVVARPAGEVPG